MPPRPPFLCTSLFDVNRDQSFPDIAPSPDHIRAFRNDLLKWFDVEQRAMPWRRTDDPYRIWVSEVMLQQTRVDQAEPYYRRFVERFPTVEDLARADLDDVLLCWEGLGYYSRARNLHAAAGRVVNDFDGRVPSDEALLRTLPGVGPYTAAAVLSIAYDRPHAAVDGNVTRVVARVFRIESDIRSSVARAQITRLADTLIDPDRPGRFNQAVMELGSTICTPRSPRCPACPIRPVCAAAAKGDPENFPITASRRPVPHHIIAVALLFNERGRLLIQKRPEHKMLGGLWEFPGGKQEHGESPAETCRREVEEELGLRIEVGEPFHVLSHAYSHFRITLYAFVARVAENAVTSEPGRLEWVEMERLREYAFPRANRKLLERLEGDFGAEFATGSISS